MLQETMRYVGHTRERRRREGGGVDGP